MIISLIETQELPNFGLMTNLQYNLSYVIIFFGDVIDRKSDVIASISKELILRKPRAANLGDMIKIVTMIFKDSKKVKRIRNCGPKRNPRL